MKTPTQNPKIEILPEHIIDQIKAGEVLERPASLIKELVENSIDANADEINIHLIENGMELLSIEDNGHGMSFENLPYAFLRHATSKLKSFEDLYHLRSFGFRGEALASVAACARVTCVTQPLDLGQEGGKLIVHGGAQELLIPYRQANRGTSLYIKDLFYNTPARLKFVKSKISEKSALRKMMYSFVLSNPQISFSIKWDDKEKEIFKKVESSPLSRIENVFFGKPSDQPGHLVWHSSESYERYKVDIFFTPATHSSPQYRHHYLFANNRFFIDRQIHQALLRNLDSLWRFGESGHYFVKITAPPEEIDVNVHPNKTQIKFLKTDVIFSLLVTSIKNALRFHQPNPVAPILSGMPASQNSFLTKEETQHFNLKQMTSGEDINHAPSFPSFYAETKTTESSSALEILGLISKGLVLFKFNSSFYIAKVAKLVAIYFVESMLDFTKSDEAAGPLLISEPFKIKEGEVDQHFEKLKNMGFELDRLNHEVIALRTLPQFVPQFLAREVVSILLAFFATEKNKHFDSPSAQVFFRENWNSQIDLPETLLLKIASEVFKMKHDAFHELTEEKLKGYLE